MFVWLCFHFGFANNTDQTIIAFYDWTEIYNWETKKIKIKNNSNIFLVFYVVDNWNLVFWNINKQLILEGCNLPHATIVQIVAPFFIFYFFLYYYYYFFWYDVFVYLFSGVKKKT